VGQFSDMKDEPDTFGASAYEIIAQAVAEYHIPVMFGFQAGHTEPNYPLPLGAVVQIDVTRIFSSLTFL
jgi:muramoyltetrapeptide carboxypeptidase